MTAYPYEESAFQWQHYRDSSEAVVTIQNECTARARSNELGDVDSLVISRATAA